MTASPDRSGAGAVLYARYSPRPNEETESARHQLERCRAEARRRSLPIRGEFVDELASGADPKRVGFLAALEACRPGDELISDKVDRFSRETEFGWAAAKMLLNRGCTLRFVLGGMVVEDNPYSRFTFRTMLSHAEFEREMIAYRTSQAMQHHQRNGRRMGPIERVPYGYRLGGDDSVLVRDEAEQTVIERMLERHRSGSSWYAIAAELNAAGVPTRVDGAKWHGPTVRGIVHREKQRKTAQRSG